MRTFAVLFLLVLVTACGSGGDQDRARQEVTLRVFAAASLTESFTALGEQFEEEHPHTSVELGFGPSSGLVEPIRNGAPADVFAAASSSTMASAVRADLAKDPDEFATNRMEVAVPPENPARIDGLDDLARKDVKVALCQPQVPCGDVAAEVFGNAGITVEPATEEVDVRGVLTKVSLGEVDAGVVYVTDVRAAGDRVRGVEIPDAVNASATYPIATLTDSEHPAEARDFVDLVLSEAGARVLEDAGFGTP